MTQQQHEDSSVYGLAADDAAPAPLHPALSGTEGGGGGASSARSIEGTPCPYCQQPLVGGSKICVYCGSDVSDLLAKSRAAPVRGRPAPVPAPAVGPPAPAPPKLMSLPVAAPTRDREGPPRTRRMSIVILSLVLLIIAVGAIQGLRMIMRSAGHAAAHSDAGSADASSPTNESDAAVLAQIKDEHGTEARAWLSASEERSLMSLSHAQSVGRVEDLYRVGAKQVIAFGSRISATVAVELPDDAARRKAVFDWAERWNREHRFESDRDTGQRWLVIRMPF